MRTAALLAVLAAGLAGCMMTDVRQDEERAQAALENRDWEEAVTRYNRLIRVFPRRAEYRAKIALAFANSGKWDKADRASGDAIQLDPMCAVGHYVRGNCLLRENKCDEAIQHFRKAADADSKMIEARLNQGLAHERVGEWEQAEAAYRKVLAAIPDEPAALASLGALHLERNRLDDAVRVLELAAEADRTNARNRYRLGIAYGRLQRFDESIRSFERYLQLEPKAKDQEKINVWIGQLRIGIVPFPPPAASAPPVPAPR